MSKFSKEFVKILRKYFCDMQYRLSLCQYHQKRHSFALLHFRAHYVKVIEEIPIMKSHQSNNKLHLYSVSAKVSNTLK